MTEQPTIKPVYTVSVEMDGVRYCATLADMERIAAALEARNDGSGAASGTAERVAEAVHHATYPGFGQGPDASSDTVCVGFPTHKNGAWHVERRFRAVAQPARGLERAKKRATDA